MKQKRDELNLLMTCTTVAYAGCLRYMSTGSLNVSLCIADHQHHGYRVTSTLKNRTTETELDFKAVDAVKDLPLQHNMKGGQVLKKCLAKYGLTFSEYNEVESSITENGIRKTSITNVNLTLSKI
eukprot:11056766-Ditylum_brightwellii.AAC.1